MKNKKFTEAYKQMFKTVSTVLSSKVGNNKMDAEDLAQEIFLLYYTKMNEVENLRTWIYGVMTNKLREYYRAKHHSEEDTELLLNNAEFTFTNGFRDARMIIQSAIRNNDIYNDDKEKEIFTLIAVYDLSMSDVAKNYGYSLSSVHQSYHRVQKRVRDLLVKQGIKKLEDLL